MILNLLLILLFSTFALFEAEEKLRFPPESITKENILSEYDKISDDEVSHFSGASLAYVTPWNNKGYDLAKETANKLTHISPVWLQLKPQVSDRSCLIRGDHDLDQGWIADLRSKNPEIKIVPRVLFEDWSIEDLLDMMEDETWSRSCMTDMINFLLRNRLDGVVLELWNFALIHSKGRAAPSVIEFINSWGDFSFEKDLQTIVAVGAPLHTENQPNGMFTAAHLYALAPHVDYIHMMTYDYPAKIFDGVAPYNWVKACIEYVLDGSQVLANKLMIGINFYGIRYSTKNPGNILYDEYIKLLKTQHYTLEWDHKSQEHLLKNRPTYVYYPSLTSIELRLKLAEEYGVGIAIWDYGQGFNYFTQIL